MARQQNKRTNFIIASAGFALVGLLLLASSLAANSNVGFDIGGSTSSGGVDVISDSLAHGGDHIAFKEKGETGWEYTRIPVADIADSVPAANVIDAGCTPSPDDCMAKINQVISSNAQKSPLKITFGGSSQPYEFSSRWNARSNISIEGVGQPEVKLSIPKGPNSVKYPVFETSGLQNISFRGFDVDADKGSKVDRLFDSVGAVGPKNVHISDMKVKNGSAAIADGDGGGSMFYRVGKTGAGRSVSQADGLYIRNVEVDNFFRGVFLHGRVDYKNVYIQDSTFSQYFKSALSFDGISRNIYLEGNVFNEHSINACQRRDDNGKNSNPVHFQVVRPSSPARKHFNVEVRGNKFYGKEGATASDCGGSGDLIAFRGTDAFVVEYNEFYHSGEVALTATAGIRNGVIRYNTIDGSDFSGIQVGNTIKGNEIVVNVDVYGNNVNNAGLDIYKRQNGTFVLPGIAHWPVDGVCTVNNVVTNNRKDGKKNVGIWIHDGTFRGTTFPNINKNIYISKNSVSGSTTQIGKSKPNVQLDYAQSGHPNANSSSPPVPMEFAAMGFDTGFYGGVPDKGQDWTYGSALTAGGIHDRDDDGFHSGCFSETNDNDPCIPDKTAAICRQ